MFEGVSVALVTPFDERGHVDHAGLSRLCEHLIARGVAGLVPCGTTGESATLDHEEHIAVIRTVVAAARGRVWVMAGTGSNATAEAIALTHGAKEAGANGALMIAPYYTRPTQEGLAQHFLAVADAVDLPIVLYNIPGRTAVKIEPDTVGRLARHPRIVGLKEATGSIDVATQTLLQTPESFTMLAGDDAMTLPLVGIGARGVISVVAHLLPERLTAMIAAYRAGDVAAAAAAHRAMFPLIASLFVETNPGPIKEALYLMGQIDRADLRLPLVRPSVPTRARLREALSAAGLEPVRGW